MRDTAGHMGDQAACLEPARNSGPRMEGSVAAARTLPTAPADFIPAPATNTPMASFFVGNVPITSNSLSVDTITAAFHNSSRKTLSYIPPTLQNGETIVRPSLDTIRNGAQRWATTAVGYFLEMGTGHGASEVTAYSGTCLDQTETPTVELWTTEGLSIVASGVGKPLYPDAITRACTRLDFARVCVMLDISAKLLKHIVIMIPKEDGSEMACKVDVEYEWLPPKCTACHSLGHPIKDCPTMKPKPPPVSVYVQKPRPQMPREHSTVERRQPSHPVKQPRVPRPGAVHCDESRGVDDDAIQGPNSSPIAHLMINAAVWNVRGLNRRDHQVSVSDLITEHCLHFIGLLETRVTVGNVARVQRGLLPQWTYYVDYGGPGNRVWLAWDTDFVDVTVVETGAQFIHCAVFIRSMHLSVLITVVYGVNDIVGRRELWSDLARFSTEIADTPWLVGGDFNTVLDSSEVCGQSGDISGAAEEFRACLHDTGVPAAFTWHNCSRDARSLWKRLDRLLVNDSWLNRWPDTFDNYLARSAEFIPSVHSIWRHRIVGSAMYAVTRKLKALKPIFREQRKRKGDLSTNVSLAKGFLDSAQSLLATDRHCPTLLHLELC
ncbi:UNVERIFIED_CONTAM: hypothetical protein Sradi_7174000, partial [Sesamum radiatum]